VGYDKYYLHNRSFALDLKIMGMTILKALIAEGVRH
jgi:lipopolysaccharide/colanic/teichoic acid biosynthesis glycosyltransferase